MKRILSLSFALLILSCILLAVSISAQADEIDWDNVNWEHFDWELLDDSDVRKSLIAWLRNEASFEEYFSFENARRNGGCEVYSEGFAMITGDRFLADPQGMLYALADLGKSERSIFIRAIGYFSIDWNQLCTVLETVTLQGDKADEGYEVLAEMIEFMNNEFGTNISNPKTGDPVGIVMAAMAVCGISGAVMLIRRKEE